MAIQYTFGTYSELFHYDWKDVDNVGIDAPAYLLTGYLSGGDYQRNKQVVYMTTHFGRTEHFSAPPPALTLEGNFVGGTPNSSYSSSITISGGVAPYTLSNITGTLPTGLSLFIDGNLVRLVGVSGAPQQATFSFDVNSSDGQTVSTQQTVKIHSTFALVTASPSSSSSRVVKIFSKPEQGWNRVQQFTIPLTWSNGFNSVRAKVGSPYIVLAPNGTSPTVAVIPILRFVDDYTGYVYEEHTLLGVSSINYLSAEMSLDGSLLVVAGVGTAGAGNRRGVYIFTRQDSTTWALIQQINCVTQCDNAKLSSDNKFLFADCGPSNYNGHMFKRDSSGLFQPFYAGPTYSNFYGYEITINEKNGTWLWNGAAPGRLSLVSWANPNSPITLIASSSTPPAGNYNLISNTGMNYVWSADGNFLFALSPNGDKINCYRYTPVGTGPYFTLVSSVTPTQTIDVGLDISSDGKYLFTSGNAGMQLFSVDQSSGVPVLTQVDLGGLAEISSFVNMGVLY